MKSMIFAILIFLMNGLASGQGPAEPPASRASASPDELDLRAVLSNYQNGLVKNDEKLFVSSLGKEMIMFSGNFSDDPTKWQAHLFLSGENLENWATHFVKNVGPHSSRFEFLSFHVRNNAAIVVTREAGSNKFRQWKDERVTWLLGKQDGGWKIVGFFIRDLKNPG